MKLNSMRLKNYCQHDDLFMEFKDGLNIITAPNGYGKTNMLRGLQLLMSGELPGSGSLSDEIQWGKNSAELELDMDIQSMHCKVSRTIDHDSSDVYVELGDNEYSTKGEGYTNIFECLGTDSNLMSIVPFVNQGEIHKIFFGSPTEQKKMLQKLFGTNVASSIRRLLRKELNDIKELEIETSPDKIQEKIDDKKEVINSKKDLLGNVEDFLDDCNPDKWRESINQYNNLQSSIKDWSSEIDTKEKVLEAKKAERDKLEKTIKDIDEELRCFEIKEELEEIKQRYIDEEEERNKKANLEERATKLLKSIEELDDTEFSSPDDYDEVISEWRTHLSHTKQELKAVKTFLDMEVSEEECPICGEAPNGDGLCSMCMQPIDPELADYDEADLDKLNSEIDESSDKIANLKEGKEICREKARLLKETEEVRDSLVKYRSMELVSKEDYEDVTKAISNIEELEYDKLEAESDKESVVKRITELKDELDALRAKKKEAEEKFENLDSVSNLESKLEEYEEFNNTKHKIEGNIESLQSEIEALENRLQKAIESKKKQKKRNEYREVLKEIREIMHSSCVPSVVASEGVKALNSAIATALDDLGTDFIAWRDEDTFEPIMRKTGEDEPRPANKLSGGEKSLLGVAVAIARWNIFLPSVGFLALDEPTEFMDPDNQEKLTNFISTLQSYCKTADKQLLIITNKPEVAQVSDEDIYLPELEGGG